MSQILNLIPDAFRKRAVVRKAVARWGILCGIAATAGLALCAPSWWNVCELRERVSAAEDDCGEVRRLIKEGSRLKLQLQQAEARTRRYAFAEESHLPLSVIGVFSRETRTFKGRLQIDDFSFREVTEGETSSETKQRQRVDVVLAGFSRDDSAISALIDALRRTRYFAKVELRSTGRVGAQAAGGRRFQIHCLLFVESKLA